MLAMLTMIAMPDDGNDTFEQDLRRKRRLQSAFLGVLFLLVVSGIVLALR
jgi:hypothetical protein